jgi:hypothetical protein
MPPDTEKLGWRVDSAPDSVKEVARWLAAGTRLTGVVAISAECKTKELEFVYVERRDDRLVVSDRGETAKYLERGDEFHRPLDTSVIREICESSGATLVGVHEMWPHITIDTNEGREVADAVRIVAQAIDRVIAAALTVPLA